MANIDQKYDKVAQMVKDGLDPLYILNKVIPRVSFNDLDALHKGHLRSKADQSFTATSTLLPDGMVEYRFKVS